MSGGGGGNATPTTTPKPAGQPMTTVQPAMPGQLDALSQQLAAGYGQQPADIMSQLMQYYAPMRLPDYSPQPAPAPTPTPAPAAPKPRARSIIGRPETDPNTGAYNPVRQGGANR